MRIDPAILADADLREPDARHHGRLAVSKLERHPDAADEPVAVVGQRAFAHQETLHRRVGDSLDLTRSRALKKPQGPAPHGSESYHDLDRGEQSGRVESRKLLIRP